MERTALLENWLRTVLPERTPILSPASADASFRRYFRVQTGTDANADDKPSSLIVMDAPPGHEDCRPWLSIAALLREAGVHVPDVFAEDLDNGFVLMSDLGDTTYLSALDEHNAAALYADALGSLIAMQLASRPGRLPEYSRELLMREVRLFDEWYVTRHKGVTLTESELTTLMNVYDRVINVNLSEPRVFVHRDYHSRNLMHIPGERNPGVIDFQDAVYGPLSYDLVSLFKDAYIDWDEAFVLDLLVRYWETARQLELPVRADFGDFHREFEWMGVQRHLKVLGIFARLNHRDGKAGYLEAMPRVMAYLRKACARYGDLKPLLRLLDRLDPEEVTVGYTF